LVEHSAVLYRGGSLSHTAFVPAGKENLGARS
jgi:hypothetical protein